METIWREERDSLADIIVARKAARKATGLTTRRLASWKMPGKTTHRMQVSTLPPASWRANTLCAGHRDGYLSDNGMTTRTMPRSCGTFFAMNEPRIKSRHDPEILRHAADMVHRAGDGPKRFGPFDVLYVAFRGIPQPRRNPWRALNRERSPWIEKR